MARAPAYLSSYAYSVANQPLMWSADDFVVPAAGGGERPWQNLILVTGNETAFAELSAEVLTRTGAALPMLWQWTGWQDSNMEQSWRAFTSRYTSLARAYRHLPATPWGV